MKKTLLFIATSLVTLVATAQIPSAGLIGHYSFSGNANDNSGNSNNGVVTNATLTTDRFGNANSAYLFSGQSNTTSYITIPHISAYNTETFSVSCWYKTTSTGYGRITTKQNSTNYMSIYGYNGVFHGSAWNGSTEIVTENPNSTNDGKWHHVVYISDKVAGKLYLYVDNVLQATSNNTFGNIANTADLLIGSTSNWQQYNHTFNGVLDDFRFYNTAITANDVTALYNESPSCLVAHYPFTGNASDASGNGNDATVSNATLTTDRFGAANSAYLFNGTSSYINSTFPAISSNSTITFWFYTNASYSNGPNFLETSSSFCSINQNDGTLDYAQNLSSGNAYVNSGAVNPNTLGNWHFVAIKYATDTISIFVDGVKKNATKTTGTLTPISSLLLGKRPNNTGFFNGKLDDVKVYSCALSSSEISSLFNESICKQSISVTDTLIINMNITGYNPISYSNAIKIYPNPANDQLNISIANGNNNGYQIKVINTLSQVMWSQTITGSTYSMSLSGFSAGTYFVNVYDGQGNLVEVKKLILQ